MNACLSVLLRLWLQFILLWLEEVLNNGIDQVIQLLLQMIQITVERPKESKGSTKDDNEVAVEINEVDIHSYDI